MNMLNSSMNSTLSNSNPEWIELGVHIASTVTFFIGFPTNFIIVFLVLRRNNLKVPTNFFVCSLACADILVLLCMMFWLACIHLAPHSPFLVSYFNPSLDMFHGIAAMLNVACVSADRAVAVAYPLKYEAIITTKKTFFTILLCWLYSFVILILAMLRITIQNTSYHQFVLYLGFISFFIPVSIVVGSYVFILVVIVNKLKGMRELERFVEHRPLNDQQKIEKRRRRRRKLLREFKVTGNILFIVVPFTTGWTFFVGTHVYDAIQKAPIQNMAHNFAIIITPWILSGLNPILYLLLNRSLRLSFISTFKKLFKSQSYYIDDTRTTFLSTFSRRASNPFRRQSNTLGYEGGNEGGNFLALPKFLTRRRDSKMSGISVQSKESDIVIRETELHLSQCNEHDESSLQSASFL